MESPRVILTPTVARQTPKNEFGNVLKGAMQQVANVGGAMLGSIPGGGLVSAAINQVTAFTNGAASVTSAATGITSVGPGPSGVLAASTQGLPSSVSGLVEQMRHEADRSMLMQMQMQQESREYNTLSNVLKVRHDSAKAAINNIR
jgi:hypothetical protein